MIAPDMIQEVERLLAEGVTQREIARRLPVNRESIARIASGWRDARAFRRQTEHDAERLAWPLGAAERCPRCGGVVLMPCRRCLTESARTRPAHPARDENDSDEGDVFRLQLRRRSRRRYEQLHARKIREEEEANREPLELEPVAPEPPAPAEWNEEEPPLDLGDLFEEYRPHVDTLAGRI